MIVMFRKGDNRPKVTAAVVDLFYRVYDAVCRKPRPLFVAAFLPGARGARSVAYSLPVVPAKVLRNSAALLLLGPDHSDYSDPAPVGARWVDCGWVVPDDGLGLTVENARLFVKNNLGMLCTPDDFGFVHLTDVRMSAAK